MSQKTIADIKAFKNQDTPLVCLTAYTAPMAAAIAPHCDIILVGDSLGMVLYGMDSTRGVNLDMMINHGQAVMRRRGEACVVIDLPFGTYEDSPAQALESARRVMDETGCDGIKLEGGAQIASTVQHLTQHDIPVMGHIGLLPQSVENGQFRIQGKTAEQTAKLLTDAKALEEAGAFTIVIEGTIEHVATEITQAITIPTIGIGGSAQCDGQVLVTEDILGMLDGHTPKFVKQYANLRSTMDQAIAQFAGEVRNRSFPGKDQLYTLPPQKIDQAS